MKSLRKLALSAVALSLIAAPIVAGIHKKAPGASHALEEAADELHSHMHHTYGPSFGAHGMEDTAGELHDTLHDWQYGSATEADVMGSLGAANDAFDDMTDQFNEQGFLSGPNKDHEAKKLYDEVHKYKVLVNAYTN